MKNIYLIGMPSSGKSTLGKRLARELMYFFVDTDRMIIREEGRTIPEIFSQSGEVYFREAEARVLRTIRPGGSQVIATGGGMPCFHDNMAYIKATGVSIFLDVSPEAILARMQVHAQEYPLMPRIDPCTIPTMMNCWVRCARNTTTASTSTGRPTSPLVATPPCRTS